MKISISQITTMYGDVEREIALLKESGWRHVEVLFSQLADYLADHCVEELRARLDGAGLRAVGGVGFARETPGVLLARGGERRAFMEELESQLSMCRVLGVQCLGLGAEPARFSFPGWEDTAVENLRAAALMAESYRVDIGIEFCVLDPPAVLADLAATIRLVHRVNHPRVGYILDLFHFFKGGGTLELLESADLTKLYNVHLCDLPHRPIEQVADADRVLPGEGVLALDEIAALLKRKGYDRYLCLEMLNPRVWAIPAEDRARRCMEAMEPFLSV